MRGDGRLFMTMRYYDNPTGSNHPPPRNSRTVPLSPRERELKVSRARNFLKESIRYSRYFLQPKLFKLCYCEYLGNINSLGHKQPHRYSIRKGLTP